MTALLYGWPAAAKFGSRVPKDKFYEHGTVTTAVREKFVSEVQRITWAYKLAESTINLPGTEAVPEVQVFQIDAKGADVSEAVLAAIDKAIPFPIIFEITRPVAALGSGHGVIRMTAAHKHAGTGAPKLSSYFTTDWLPADQERLSLPTAITLPALYASLLEPLTKVQVRPGEDVSEVAARLKTIGALERDIEALKRKLRSEKQFNFKVELRRELKARQAQLEQQR
ncbi:DUF4391 domain-containing protein [Specibacter cremeus]|uniref:DUF4391 domain-containing protein n=1 Tax=Specibacter cremeus TaxID=1629051 RepID=UPI000F7823BD|nr:DUF4391 domain-containing protein [Specibacter cremeus]